MVDSSPACRALKFKNNYVAALWSGAEEGSSLRLTSVDLGEVELVVNPPHACRSTHVVDTTPMAPTSAESSKHHRGKEFIVQSSRSVCPQVVSRRLRPTIRPPRTCIRPLCYEEMNARTIQICQLRRGGSCCRYRPCLPPRDKFASTFEGRGGLWYGSLNHEEEMRQAAGAMRDLNRTSICGKYSGSMKFTTHLDHIRHCETASGSNWSNRRTYRVFTIHTRCD